MKGLTRKYIYKNHFPIFKLHVLLLLLINIHTSNQIIYEESKYLKNKKIVFRSSRRLTLFGGNVNLICIVQVDRHSMNRVGRFSRIPIVTILTMHHVFNIHL